MFSVNEENPPTQKCTCVSLEWPRKEARDTETDSLSPREMPCGWRLREASKSCSAVNLASQCSSDRRKTVTPKALLPAQVPRGTEQIRGKMTFLGGSEEGKDSSRVSGSLPPLSHCIFMTQPCHSGSGWSQGRGSPLAQESLPSCVLCRLTQPLCDFEGWLQVA